jgi:AmiR/NasT family two-component response regulator
MPVIEQAKGILMAQHRCGPEEAFDLLRRASQSANVRVSVLAARMVEQIASHEPQTTGESSTAQVRP